MPSNSVFYWWMDYIYNPTSHFTCLLGWVYFRCFFLSAVVDAKVYVTTGLGLGSGLKAWDIFDAKSNSWMSEANPAPIVDLVKSTSFDDKIYTFHKTWFDTHYARVYDPSIRKWDDVHNEIASYHCGPTAVVDGTLYMLDETSGTRLMMWRKETEEWVLLGRLSQHLTKPPCHLAVIGRSIFVIGCGLRTVIVNVDQAANAKGMLVTSSFDPHVDGILDRIGCKTIAI